MSVRNTQEPVEVLGTGTPNVRATQIYVEVISSNLPPSTISRLSSNQTLTTLAGLPLQKILK